ncbi:MAG: hypothetical protein GWN99_02140 [Gemmatimonadetes bacterium]|uniref:PKD domain-containing protein n=1 Tax=Candidatus Kutchimonas denitrificans TaxID=3056748 RepID=A0AAE4Z9Y6_9BACT|nr:hypothetical protein [Gemmatimonadota bacterium]NIR74246.1 hypothetical protein [Candidatus Kutchimonas denitrificans]NIR99868.1 hypothetical protein [Gemmatimonadota bacterium]NIT65457.1 hypothetical protein [Gemmatimonadota bacterium]NIU51822.1 hypothetical protein [Gemmatimonadota bacterium]
MFRALRKIGTLFTSVFVLLVAAGCADQEPAGPASPTEPPGVQVDVDRTAFQRGVLEIIDQREAQGLPVPSEVSFEYISAEEAGAPKPGAAAEAGEPTTMVATTIIRFDNPAQAGLEKWPDFVVEGEMLQGAEGFVRAGNYSEVVKEEIDRLSPGYWEEHEFGYEPRVYTYTEKFSSREARRNDGGALESVEALASSTSLDEFVMGFTISGPYDEPWEISKKVSIPIPIVGDVDVFEFSASLELDFGLGVRLPMEVTLTSTEPMLEGSIYSSTSNATGLDWSEDDFLTAGVEPEGGNELVMFFVFQASLHLWVVGAGDIIDQTFGPDFDRSRSFTTPFGPGSLWDLVTINIPIFPSQDFGVASLGVDFALTPSVGSEKFTANWVASGEASGSGNLTYTDPLAPETVGPIQAIDGPGNADIQLDAFKFYFTEFVLNLAFAITLGIDVTVSGVGYSDDFTFTQDLATFDLSDIFPDVAVPVHQGTSGAFNTSVFIENVPPTAEIDRSSAVLINGVPTFMAQASDPLTFSGRSTDPGRDDLTLSWDWDDGAPSPDVSTTYPVPHDVAESQSHAFDAACVYQVGFRSVDDDLAFAEDHVPVVITSGGLGNAARSEGYWQHQLRGNGRTDFDEESLLCYLAVVGHMSSVFSEVRDASTIQAAHEVIFLQMNNGSAIKQLDRELLVAWLNFVNGAVDYTEAVDTDKDQVPDTPFADAMAAAESVRLDPFATAEQIRRMTDTVHHITNTLKH